MENNAGFDQFLSTNLPPDADYRQELEAEIIRLDKLHPAASPDCPDNRWLNDWEHIWSRLHDYYRSHADVMMSVRIVSAYLSRLEGWFRLKQQMLPCNDAIDEAMSTLEWFMQRIIVIVEERTQVD